MKFDLRTSILAQAKMEVNIMFKLHICMLGIHLLFSKLNLSKTIFQKPYQSVKRFGSRSRWTGLGPDLGLNCLQSVSADENKVTPGKD